MKEMYGTIEAGGTKFLCAVGNNPDSLHAIERFPTTTPNETIKRIIHYFRAMKQKYIIKAIGIASFGPINLQKNSQTYGYITSTPKLAWQNTDLVQFLSKKLAIPIGIDTDVNGSALAEGKWGVAKGMHTFVYITVGTGVGVGIIANNTPIHGLIHPEGGHMLLTIHKNDPIHGICPFHENCLEGLASGPSIERRWKLEGSHLPPNHIAWDIEAYYIAQGVHNLICTLSPQKIIMGGGIMQQSHLFAKIHSYVKESLNKYIVAHEILNKIETYIVPPKLNYCGLLGGIHIAKTLCTTLPKIK